MTKRLYQTYLTALSLVLVVAVMITPALAVENMWTVANRIIVDVYAKIVSISTVLAGLMSAIAVIGAKLSNNQQKTDQAWDWLKRIWLAWAVINGIGAFIAYFPRLCGVGVRAGAGMLGVFLDRAAGHYEHGLCVHEKPCSRDGRNHTGAYGGRMGASDR